MAPLFFRGTAIGCFFVSARDLMVQGGPRGTHSFVAGSALDISM